MRSELRSKANLPLLSLIEVRTTGTIAELILGCFVLPLRPDWMSLMRRTGVLSVAADCPDWPPCDGHIGGFA